MHKNKMSGIEKHHPTASPGIAVGRPPMPEIIDALDTFLQEFNCFREHMRDKLAPWTSSCVTTDAEGPLYEGPRDMGPYFNHLQTIINGLDRTLADCKTILAQSNI